MEVFPSWHAGDGEVKTMFMRNILLLVLGLFSSICGYGQLQKITHQTFTVSDSVTILVIAPYGDYQFEAWPGNKIMLETKIKLYNATGSILDFLLESGRYEVIIEREEALLRLVSKDKKRQAIRTKKGECFEEVEMRFFIPEEFISDGEHQWSRPSPLTRENPKGEGN